MGDVGVRFVLRAAACGRARWRQRSEWHGKSRQTPATLAVASAAPKLKAVAALEAAGANGWHTQSSPPISAAA